MKRTIPDILMLNEVFSRTFLVTPKIRSNYMKKLLTIAVLLCTLYLHAQTDNMNFETGDFTGWTLDLGERIDGTTEDYTTGGFRDINDHIKIMNPTVPPLDEYGILCSTVDIPTVFPGGLFSARIGNLEGGKVATKISRTFTVTENEAYLLYSYAIILQDPDHSEEEQPKFVVNIRNSAGEIVTCGKFEAFAGPNAADQGFINCELDRDYDCDFPITDCADAFGVSSIIQILPWTSGGADLTPFLGEQITIEFVILDCLKGGHGATAYLETSVGDLTIGVNSFCQPTNGGALTLTAPIGFVGYSWPHSGETTQSVTIDNPTEGDSYTVDLTSNTGCDTSTEIVLEIKPDAEIDPIMVAPICKGASVTVIPTGNNANSFYFEEIDFTGTSAVLTPDVTTTYTVFALNENGCRGASTTFEVEVLDFGGPLFPEAIFELTPTVDAMGNCNTVQFTNLSGYCKGGLTYEWDFGDGSPVSTEENPLHTFPNIATQQTYTITLVVTAADGATASTSDTFQSQGIVPLFEVLPPDCGSIRVVNTSEFCGNPFTDSTIFSYSWDFDDGSAPVVTDETQTEIPYVYTASGDYRITLTMTNTNTGVAFVYTSTPIEITASLASDFEYTPDECLTVAFRNLSVFCDPITSYAWDFGDGGPGSTTENPTHTYTTVGPHTVTLTVGDGTTTQTSTQTLTLTPQNSVADFTFTQVCEELWFTDTSTSCWSPITYAWDFGDGSPVSTARNPRHAFEYGNTYTITLTINDGLGDVQTTQTIAVNPEFDFTAPEDLEACGIPGVIEAEFNLQSQTERILENVPAGTANPPVVTYYATEEDANNGLNPLSNFYTARAATQTLFANVVEALGCTTLFSFEVRVGRTPEVVTIPDIFLCLEEGNTSVYDLTQLNARFFEGLDQTNTALTYHESMDDASTAANPITSITLEAGVPITIYVRAADTTSDCFVVTEFALRIDNRETDQTSICFLKVSNTMTPNADGRNDTFMIANIEGFPRNTVHVYNRWGNLVFKARGYDNSWAGTFEGKPLPVGTYYYVVELNDDKSRTSSGYLSILR